MESVDPGRLAELLNDDLAEMTSVVFAHDGTVAKIVGDAIPVLFGAPANQPDHAARAVACTLDLDTCAEMVRARWKGHGIALGVTRIGVHAGPAIVGNFGSGRFFDDTAYGDTIDTTARLEVADKQLGTRVCVSSVVAERAAGFHGRPVGDLMLRGKSEPLRAFEPLSLEASQSATTARYCEAFAKLEGGDGAAMPAFAAIVGQNPNDCLASLHLKRLLNGAAGTRIELN